MGHNKRYSDCSPRTTLSFINILNIDVNANRDIYSNHTRHDMIDLDRMSHQQCTKYYLNYDDCDIFAEILLAVKSATARL